MIDAGNIPPYIVLKDSGLPREFIKRTKKVWQGAECDGAEVNTFGGKAKLAGDMVEDCPRGPTQDVLRFRVAFTTHEQNLRGLGLRTDVAQTRRLTDGESRA